MTTDIMFNVNNTMILFKTNLKKEVSLFIPTHLPLCLHSIKSTSFSKKDTLEQLILSRITIRFNQVVPFSFVFHKS